MIQYNEKWVCIILDFFEKRGLICDFANKDEKFAIQSSKLVKKYLLDNFNLDIKDIKFEFKTKKLDEDK